MRRSILSAWDNFWFALASPVPMALFRILIGLSVVDLLLTQFTPELFTWFGAKGILTIDTVRAAAPGPGLDLFLLLPKSDTWLAAGFCGVVLAAVTMTLGLFFRLSAAIVFLGLVSLFHHNPLIMQGPERLLIFSLLFLLMSNAGRSLSIDNLIRSGKTSGSKVWIAAPLCSPWAQRLVQLELSILYLECVATKLLGVPWRDGTAVYYTSRIQTYFRFDVPYLFDHIWTIKLLTWATIGIEAALALLLWWRPARYWVMVLGILFHASIDSTMNVPTFGWITVFAYITFVDSDDLRKLWIWLLAPFKHRWAKPIVLLFDGLRIDAAKVAGLLQPLNVLFSLKPVVWAAVVVLIGLSAMAWIKPVDGFTRRSQRLHLAEFETSSVLRAKGVSNPLKPPSPLNDQQLEEMSKLASICWQREDFARAEQLYNNILTERSLRSGWNPQLLSTLRELAGLYRDRVDFFAAAKCYSACLEHEQRFGRDHPLEQAKDTANLALIEYLSGCASDEAAVRQECFTAANLKYQGALDICAQYADRGRSITSTILANQAVLLGECKRTIRKETHSSPHDGRRIVQRKP